MVTSRDVARIAGVSQATVSRVLHNHPAVDSELRRRVQQALEKTGYVANAQARAMRTRRTGTVGVVTDRITNPFYPELIEALGTALAQAGQRMILWTSGSGGETAAVEAISAGAVDGIVFTTVTEESAALRTALARQAPIVLVNRSIDDAPCDQVTSDNARGGRLVADYFLGHGHRQVAVVGGDETVSTGRERRAGFQRRLAEAGIWLPRRLTPVTDYSHAAGLQAGRQLLSSGTPPRAVFCVNDLIAFGVSDAIREVGLSVPADLWLVGYDDVEMAGWHAYDLTTVRQPTDQMAREVTGMLLRRLANPAAPAEHCRFSAEMIVRGSTARAAVAGDG